jgi:hypothetical protein
MDQAPSASDARPLTVEELLSALHLKFSDNFSVFKLHADSANEVERQARALSVASNMLEKTAGDSVHQRELARCLDEVFGDSICAVYLSCCGMNVPARMLLRRSLELGLVVAAYWDSPVDFWAWREHDGDIRFATLCTHIRSAGYTTLCQKQARVSSVDSSKVLQDIDSLYGDLSNVVHPKPYNFSTAGANAYVFNDETMRKTLSYAGRVLSTIATLLSARFAELVPVLHKSQS